MIGSRRSFLKGIAGVGTVTAARAAGAAGADTVPDRRALAALPQQGSVALREPGREGNFVWTAGDMRREIDSDPKQGVFVASAADPFGRSGAWVRQSGDMVHVGWFGAKGDGATNDTDAINAAARLLETRGGGTLAFSRGTYLIGRQSQLPGARAAYGAWEVVAIRRCKRKVTILGNGALLKGAPGLRYGSFEPGTGAPAAVKLPFSNTDFLATPFLAAIALIANQGGVEVSNIEIDGSIGEQVVGGQWGDIGWQIPHHGIHLDTNAGPHVVRNVHAHHMGGDGMMVVTAAETEASPPIPVLIEDCRFESNGRQGVSVIGGRGYTFRRCRFLNIGRGIPISSNPGAGVDLEAEYGVIRDVSFEDCVFDGNMGPGLGADSGDIARVVFTRCRFVGAYRWALWANKPDMVFRHCTIVGAATGFFDDPSGRRANKFYNCRFSDDPRLSGSGSVYTVPLSSGPHKGTLFDGCVFTYRKMPLPYTQAGTTFHNCRMSSSAPGIAQLNGTFTGTNIIDGGADLTASTFRGRTVHNGKVISS